MFNTVAAEPGCDLTLTATDCNLAAGVPGGRHAPGASCRVPGFIVRTRSRNSILGITIDEPDVSLTDFGLALETAIFAAILARQVTHIGRVFAGGRVAFFGSAAVASLAGASTTASCAATVARSATTSSGPPPCWRSAHRRWRWSGSGPSSVCAATPPAAVTAFATVATAGYALVVLVVWREFLVAILAYAPAALFLLGVFVRRYVALRDRGEPAGIAAVLLAFAAAAVQRLEIGIHDALSGPQRALPPDPGGLVRAALRRDSQTSRRRRMSACSAVIAAD